MTESRSAEILPRLKPKPPPDPPGRHQDSAIALAVRPILLALAEVPKSLDGMKSILRLVVRRIVVGSLGTGNVERRFGEAAKKVHDTRSWAAMLDDLGDLNPERGDFIAQLQKRSFSKGALAFLRRSILAQSITPEANGVLHFIWTRQAPDWIGMSEEDGEFWGSTIGNSFLSGSVRRHRDADDWAGFKNHMLPTAIEGEWVQELEPVRVWNAQAVERIGAELAQAAGKIWYR